MIRRWKKSGCCDYIKEDEHGNQVLSGRAELLAMPMETAHRRILHRDFPGDTARGFKIVAPQECI